MARIRTIINRSKLYEAILAKKSYLCVGLDPDPDLIPACFGSGVDAIEAFCISIINCTQHVAVAYKPNLAFFEPYGAEGQPLEWVAPQNLPYYEFPAANEPIVAAARLPVQYLIVPGDLDADTYLHGIKKAIYGGIKLIQLRAPNGYDPKYRDLAVDAVGLCAGKAQLMIKGPFEWLGDFPAAGWHMDSEQLLKYASKGRPLPKYRWLAASCHNAEELELAQMMGVDFVTLSPVHPTHTHPHQRPPFPYPSHTHPFPQPHTTPQPPLFSINSPCRDFSWS